MTESAGDLPEPTAVDEEKARELQHLVEDAVLKPRPYGDEKCRVCLYYLDTDQEFSYCWHPKIRILVSGEWWCQWWEEQPTD
jgi:hypothetical protein